MPHSLSSCNQVSRLEDSDLLLGLSLIAGKERGSLVLRVGVLGAPFPPNLHDERWHRDVAYIDTGRGVQRHSPLAYTVAGLNGL